MPTLRLLTFNALMKGAVRPRLRALGALLDRSTYDVVCLQEVMWRTNARAFTRTYPHVVTTGAVLLNGGLVTLSRLPVRRLAFTRYPIGPPLRPEHLMRKGAQVTLVGGLALVNTHLSANRDDDWSAGNRYTEIERAELSRLASRISDLGTTTPVVAAGDFNVPHTSPLLTDFLASTGLRDALAGDRGPTYRPTPEFPTPPAFDHILVSPAISTQARVVLQDDAVSLRGGRTAYLSDHYGVEAELSW